MSVVTRIQSALRSIFRKEELEFIGFIEQSFGAGSPMDSGETDGTTK